MASSQANALGSSKISTMNSQSGTSTQSSRNGTDRQTPVYQNAGAPNFRAPLKLQQAAQHHQQLDINLPNSTNIQQAVSQPRKAATPTTAAVSKSPLQLQLMQQQQQHQNVTTLGAVKRGISPNSQLRQGGAGKFTPTGGAGFATAQNFYQQQQQSQKMTIERQLTPPPPQGQPSSSALLKGGPSKPIAQKNLAIQPQFYQMKNSQMPGAPSQISSSSSQQQQQQFVSYQQSQHPGTQAMKSQTKRVIGTGQGQQQQGVGNNIENISPLHHHHPMGGGVLGRPQMTQQQYEQQLHIQQQQQQQQQMKRAAETKSHMNSL